MKRKILLNGFLDLEMSAVDKPKRLTLSLAELTPLR